jgi:hypothetical protein
MGHPGSLIQDYVAGIPIWYNPNKKTLAALAATGSGFVGPSTAASLPAGPSWLQPMLSVL